MKDNDLRSYLEGLAFAKAAATGLKAGIDAYVDQVTALAVAQPNLWLDKAPAMPSEPVNAK